MKTSDFIKDADHESNLGVSDTASDLAIRLNPAEAEKATDVVKKIIEDETSTSLSELVHDEAKLLSSLDEYAINLVIHSVAKSIDINSDLCDVLFKHDSNLLIYQDQELNTPLHYLAERGLDLFGKVPMRWLLIRNRKGATVLHILAKNKSIADKVLALPPSILAMKTKNKISIQDTVVNQKKDIDLATINKALKTAVARATLNSTKTMVFTSFDGWYAVLEANPNELQHAINYTSGLIVDLFNRLTNS
jgi:hypothetical protein